ncbi:unnamed protein product [Bursaphelenchus okinawaensis]|uniref:THAP-type domain-containing protein n=1 Tax=Bursaphelenchus okinawaensis TaxID=465554 RepID=A0A811KRM4_9BILA|nr:unnamed protein product [Bursaphelenchus okinawaensis]CAG9109914.1 unnamed protein product [Bursaphelenchus okinawaensis]
MMKCTVCEVPMPPFATFPIDYAEREMWCRRLGLLPVVPPRHYRVCSRHFEDGSFSLGGVRFRSALPMIMAQPETEEARVKSRGIEQQTIRTPRKKSFDCSQQEDVVALTPFKKKKPSISTEYPKYYIEDLSRTLSYKYCPLCGYKIEQMKVRLQGLA